MARRSLKRHGADCRCVECAAKRRKATSRASASTTRRGSGSRGRSSSARGAASASRRTSAARASSRSASTRGGSRAAAHALADHDEIRRWAEERGAHPACVRGTGGSDDIGMIRLDFPGYSGADSLQAIEWGEWFRKFDERNLALLVQDTTARGQKNFNQLVNRGTDGRGSRSRANERRTATSDRRSAQRRRSA